MEAASGPQGLLLARSGSAALVILEVDPPDGSGLETARRLRAETATASLPILHLATTSAQAFSVAAGLESGSDVYLCRPLPEEVLLAQVEALLRRGRLSLKMVQAEREAAARAQQAAAPLEELQAINEELAATNEELEAANEEFRASQEELLHQQEALRESEARYRTLFESMHEGFFLAEVICDASGRPLDGRFLDANPAAQALTGLPREQTIGRTAREVLPGIEEIWIEALGRVALTGEPAHLEGLVAPLGRYCSVTAHSPQPGLVAAVFSDITELVEAREERERQREHLLAAERARAELAETLNREIAHRTKNQLAMLAGLLQVQMLQQRDFGTATALSDAMSRVLTFASVQQELQGGTAGLLDLLPILRRVAAANGHPAAARGVAVTVSGTAVALPAKVATNLAVIANELITNAVKHGGPGRDSKLRVRVTLRVAGGFLRLRVWNSGNPVPRDFGVGQQRGLGLLLVRDLAVGEYGGAFTLCPEAGGTRAEVAVPMEATRRP